MPLLGCFFEVYSIMTEKQRLKPKNASSLQFFASFDTLLDPRGTKVVEIKITSKTALFEMILRANTPVWYGPLVFWSNKEKYLPLFPLKSQ